MKSRSSVQDCTIMLWATIASALFALLIKGEISKHSFVRRKPVAKLK